MGRPKKDSNPFDALDLEYKSAIESGTDAEIRVRVAQVMKDQYELTKAKKLDKDLQEKKAAVEKLSEKYKDGSALNSIRMKYSAFDMEIADLAFAEIELEKEKEADQDLENAVGELKYANEPYSEGKKRNGLKIAYAHYVLSGRGKV